MPSVWQMRQGVPQECFGHDFISFPSPCACQNSRLLHRLQGMHSGLPLPGHSEPGETTMNAKSIATPLTIASAVPLCFTGVCLLLRLRGGLIDPIHEISSIFFLAGVMLHTWNHKKIVLNHLKQPLSRRLLAFFSLLGFVAVVSLFLGDHETFKAHATHGNRAPLKIDPQEPKPD